MEENGHKRVNAPETVRKSIPQLRRERSEVRQRLGLYQPSVNPFLNRTIETSVGEKIKMGICAVTLLPIRVLAILLAVPILYIIGSVVMLGVDKESYSKQPFKGWRRSCHYVYSYIIRAILFVLGFYYISCKGKPASRKEAKIIVANHQTFIDAPLLFALYTPIFVAKKDVLKTPALGKAVESVQPILVDRLDTNSRHTTIELIKERTKEDSLEWPQLVVFPEGTTTNGTALITFKIGAFIPGKPVQPVIIRYPYVNFDLSWSGNAEGGTLFFRMLCQFVNYVEVEFLPVMKPSNEKERMDPNAYAQKVRRAMAQALNVPTTEHSYNDVLLQYEATKRDLPENFGIIEADKLKREFTRMDLNEIKQQMELFSRIDTSKRGKISIDEFQTALALPDGPLVGELFRLMDFTDDGLIGFQEFCAARAVISKMIRNDENLQFAFDIFDKNHDGKIDFSELTDALRTAFPGLTEEQSLALIKRVKSTETVSSIDSVSFEEFCNFMNKYPEYLSMCLSSFKFDREQHAHED